MNRSVAIALLIVVSLMGGFVAGRSRARPAPPPAYSNMDGIIEIDRVGYGESFAMRLQVTCAVIDGKAERYGGGFQGAATYRVRLPDDTMLTAIKVE